MFSIALHYLPILLALASMFAANFCCELLVKVESLTSTPFRYKMTVPGIESVEELFFQGPDKKEVLIKAENCAADLWTLATFQQNDQGQWEPAKETSLKLDGNGTVEVKVHDGLQPWIGARVGVFCAQSFFCG